MVVRIISTTHKTETVLGDDQYHVCRISATVKYSVNESKPAYFYATFYATDKPHDIDELIKRTITNQDLLDDYRRKLE